MCITIMSIISLWYGKIKFRLFSTQIRLQYFVWFLAFELPPALIFCILWKKLVIVYDAFLDRMTWLVPHTHTYQQAHHAILITASMLKSGGIVIFITIQFRFDLKKSIHCNQFNDSVYSVPSWLTCRKLHRRILREHYSLCCNHLCAISSSNSSSNSA